MTRDRAPESLLPLSAVAFEILLTLSDGDAHGYHIMQEVERRTGGAMILHPGTLYRALARLLDADVVEEIDAPSNTNRDPACPERAQRVEGVRDRRDYRLTRFGRAVLMAEAARLEQQVRAARARRLLRREER